MTSDTVQFWAEVYKFRNAADENPYVNLCDLSITVLSLPHPSAHIEKVFSQMNIVKSKLRNRMGLETLNVVLRIRYGLKIVGHTCQSYTIPASVIRSVGTMAAYSRKPTAANSENASTSTYSEQQSSTSHSTIDEVGWLLGDADD